MHEKTRWGRGLAWMTTPLCFWSRRTRVWVTVIAALLCAAAALSHLHGMEGILQVSDASEYANLARGEMAEVSQPFAARPLGAMVAGSLARGLHLRLAAGFVAEAGCALLVVFGVVFWLMLQTSSPRWMLVAVATIWFWQPLVQYMALPDLWYAAMLAILLLLLDERRSMLAALWFFPLMLSRESTLLTLVCLLAAGGLPRWRQRGVAVVAFLAGMVVVARVGRAARPNVEHLPPALYLIAKVPWNFARNVLGLRPWSSLNQELCAVPAWQMPLHLGPVTAVGICRYSAENQLIAVWALLSNFGLLPLLCGFLGWRLYRGDGLRWRAGTPLFRFVCLYGVASLLLAPVLGAGMVHLLGYAWPLFLVVPPMLFDRGLRADGTAPAVWASVVWASVVFFGLHLIACAVTLQASLPRAIASQVVLWLFGYAALRRWFGEQRRA